MRPHERRSLDQIHRVLTRGSEFRDRESSLSLLEHSMTCGQLAIDQKQPAGVVVAALLHDIGHLLLIDDSLDADDADLHHAMWGERWLATLLPESVTAPVGLHVEAKRYLATKSPLYKQQLHSGSAESFIAQGGVLTEHEVNALERNPHLGAALKLREFDDAAKFQLPRAVGLGDFDAFIRQMLRRSTHY